MGSWYVYIVECRDGTLYTGIAVDLEARIKEHNVGTGAKYTKPRRPVKLIYWEEAVNRSEASQREYEIKRFPRHKKLSLVSDLPR